LDIIHDDARQHLLAEGLSPKNFDEVLIPLPKET